MPAQRPRAPGRASPPAPAAGAQPHSASSAVAAPSAVGADQVRPGTRGGSTDAPAPTAGPLWKSAPERHDFPAAEAYLTLLIDPDRAKALVKALRRAPTSHQKAKDILRAAALPLLPVDDPHVSADLAKVRAGTALSPVLLVRGDLLSGRPLQVADGYHRVCASYHTDENTDIPCRVAPANPAR